MDFDCMIVAFLGGNPVSAIIGKLTVQQMMGKRVDLSDN